MTEDVVKDNFYCRLSGNVFLAKDKEPFIMIPKNIKKSLEFSRYGRDAILILSSILDYSKSNPNDSNIWNKHRVRSYFKHMNLSGYAVDKIFDVLIAYGFLYVKKIYPHKGTDNNHGVISYHYGWFANPKDNMHYNCKKEARKLRQKEKYLMKDSVEDMFVNIKEELENTNYIKEVEKNDKVKKRKNDKTKINYTKKIEYNHDNKSAMNIALTLYKDSMYNPLNKTTNIYRANYDNETLINYKNIILDDLQEMINEEDNYELAKKGYNVILKGIMNYKEADFENNEKHAENLVNKFSTFNSTNSVIDSLWKFREYNKIFCKDLNKDLNDDKEMSITTIPTIYPNDTDKEADNDNLYILDNLPVNEIMTGRQIKNAYFINFCYMLGSYLFYNTKGLIEDKNKPYSNVMLTYQDINAFTQIFQNNPELIYLPIDEITMNLLGELYNNQQDKFRK